MAKYHLFCFVLLISCTSTEQKNPDTDLDRLLNTVANFNSAFEKGEVDKLSKMITEDYVHTNGNSKSIGRDSWLNYLRNRKADIKTGSIIVHRYEMDELETIIYDGTAIVTARVTVEQTRNNKRVENQYRVTNLWVRENNDWKRAGFHDTKIK